MPARMCVLGGAFAFLVGCTSEIDETASEEPSSETADTGGPSAPDIVPVSVGFMLEGAMDMDGHLMDRVDDPEGRPVSPLVVLVFVTQNFLDGIGDPFDEICSAGAVVPPGQRAPLLPEEHFANDDGSEMFQAYEVTLDIVALTCEDRVDEDLFDFLQDVTMGIGLVPLEQSTLDEQVGISASTTNVVVQYAAFSRPGRPLEGTGISIGTLFELEPLTGTNVVDELGERVEKDLTEQPTLEAIRSADMLSQPMRFAQIASFNF